MCVITSTGAYSDSAGVEIIRRDAADYIAKRDGGKASHYSDIFLSTGASDGIKVTELCASNLGGRRGVTVLRAARLVQ